MWRTLGLVSGRIIMSIPKDIKRNNPAISEWNILSCYRGSIAHGMYVPNSDPNSIDDKDAMVICVPPKEYYLGLKQYGSRGTKEVKRGEWDIVIYEIKKFIYLLSNGNPNVLCALWNAPQYYMEVTNSGQMLIENKNLFVGKHAYRSFTGYAYSQLKRMTHFKFEGYMGSRRKTLVEKYGYDCKNAAHLIRLLRMGIEFLNDGELHVERYDATQLLDIKRGEWKLEHVQDEAQRLFDIAELAYINSKLPTSPDMDKINDLCVRIIETAWSERE